MATIVLSAVGTALGGALNGQILGLTTAVLGRAAGATLGRVIDNRLLGAGADPVETGRVDRFRLTGASEGAPIPRLFGRVRVAGQVIWATQFQETVATSGGGKGAAPQPKTREYSYSISLAVALSVGEILGIGRVWADGTEIATDGLNLRVYTGAEDQMPDPKIEAVEGAGQAPAYRGTAYVVFEDLALAPFGNRVPQFTFEVLRVPRVAGLVPEVSEAVQGVALMPGTGEYALATTPVHVQVGPGENRSANMNAPSGTSDLATSLATLKVELPNCRAASLIVSWFGSDLHCGSCVLKPKVEQTDLDGVGMPWTVSGLTRTTAETVPQDGDRPVYGGTPSDQSVIEAIHAMQAAGQAVVFYPFILMEQMAGNGLPDPYSDAEDQPVLPWRGRITLSEAPGRPGSPDATAAAEAEVAAFLGTCQPGDFLPDTDRVGYAGPPEWSYRRFILHYAHLCALAGGIDAFCIGSEMRGLTQIRGAAGFPAVAAFRTLAAEVRAILGPDVKIGYAADWSEYFGYHPQDGSGDVYFHLDPFWADADVDFIGIDNYMPLSDWRDGEDHADAHWGAIYNLDYLMANVAGGEGYDWYYHAPEAEAEQLRTPIADGAHGEPWVFRYKDLRNWWSNPHHERVGGVRSASATPWVPQSKPFWFTELGCAAIDKGPNQPNKFLDPKSSESRLPKYSTGRRDDTIQAQYLRAIHAYWADPANNPVSALYGGPMVDMSRGLVWAWDARPYPFFPGLAELWTDGPNYARGHWLNGRGSSVSLGAVTAALTERAGVDDYDVSALYGTVRGYGGDDMETGRAALQPLMLAYGFDAIERDGKIVFRNRDGRGATALSAERFALTAEQDSSLARTRAPAAEIAGRLRLSYIEADADFATRAEEAIFPDQATHGVDASDLPLVLTRTEARGIVERWLAEARVARDSVRFALPPSGLGLRAGDVVTLPPEMGGTRYRIDRVEQAGALQLDAVRIEPEIYRPSDSVEVAVRPRAFVAPVPVYPVFLDLPLIRGDEIAHAPHVAASAVPWPGSVAIHAAPQDDGYVLNTLLPAGAAIGVTETPMFAARAGVLDRGAALRVKFASGSLAGAALDAVLNGANLAAIGDGSAENWELFQFTGATLVAPRTYDLTGRLRGQAGTDAILPEVWPEGSTVVLLDGSARQIDLALSARGLARHYRIGPAGRPVDDPSYIYLVRAFDGIGLRPYAPVHLHVRETGGDLAVAWVRRTRIDGDGWLAQDVPLGETREEYRIRVEHSGSVVREATVTAPAWTYTAAQRAADALSGPYRIAVAQVSDQFGPGPFRRIDLDG